MERAFDFEYYEKYNEAIIKGLRFDNNYTCWRIISGNINDDNNPKANLIKNLKSLLDYNLSHNRKAFKDLLLLIEYNEWLLYLQKVFRFMSRGFIYQSINPNDTLDMLPIDTFERHFVDLKYIRGVSLNYSKKESENNGILLHYSDDQALFTYLDIAISLNVTGLIHKALATGCTKFHDICYEVPKLVTDISVETTDGNAMRFFEIENRSHNTIYNSYKEGELKKSLQSQQENTTRQEGIYNSFTGEIVRPTDGTYYIDDFR